MTSLDPVVIVGAARTPMGGLMGDFASLSAPELGSVAIASAVERAGVAKADIEEVVMGCVLPAGQGQAPARQASRGAGLPDATGCTTVNKMCGSGMKAAMFAHDMLLAGTNTVMLAGGMESMTNAPYLLPRARGGYRLGHDRVIDHMFLDGLEDAYDRGRLMGTFAEDAAQAYQFTRAEQDAYALASLTRARKAGQDGTFSAEIAPVTVKGRKGDVTVTRRRAARQGAAGQNPDAEGGVPRRRYGDRRQFLVDLRRRRGARHDAALGGGKAGADPACDDPRPLDLRQPAGKVPLGAGRGDQDAARQGRLAG